MKNQITFQIASSFDEFEGAKKLFEEYVLLLKVDLSFQGFSLELENIQRQYGKPDGGLVLANDGATFIGCCGIRRLDLEIAELKRMYVKNEFRGQNIGAGLLQRSIEFAKELEYKKIRLDTLENMTKAQQLYSSFGFYKIPYYRFNPLPGTIYMEKQLSV
jgi:ribosomal protein S18 acetylase RimI-like enzyme